MIEYNREGERVTPYNIEDDKKALGKILDNLTKYSALFHQNINELLTLQKKVNDGMKLTQKQREKMGELGDWFYGDVYPAIGRSIGSFRDIQHKGDW